MQRTLIYMLLGCGLILSITPSYAAKDGELWEVSMQRASGGSALGPPEKMQLCFGKGKDVKEPPQKDDPNCKTEVQTVGKKTTFKSVCKDSDSTITSTGTGEELGPFHYRNDVTIVQEMRGQPRMQDRQVGTMKRIGTACDPNEMFERFKNQRSSSQSGQSDLGTAVKPVKPAAASTATSAPVKSRTDAEPVSQPAEAVTTASGEKESVGVQGGGPGVNDAVEAGKSLLRGLLRF